MDFLTGLNLRRDKDKYEEAKKLYDHICEIITVPLQREPKLKYFLNMEEAFMNYWKGSLDEALKIYGKIERDFQEHYVLQFRLGEIYFTKGEIEKALVAFDHCEELPTQGSESEQFNRYRIKLKLAFIYWLLGSEYIDFTIEKINEAEEIYAKCIHLFSNPDLRYSNLLNNICAYYLDKYLISKDKNNQKTDKHYEIAVEKLKNLEQYLESKGLKENANTLDTIAWFYYNMYLKEGDGRNLEIAREKCQLIGERENPSTFWMTSSNIQQNHIQEIMCAK
jgi:tetratricopeptide (TPR) repeat protein